MPHLTRRRFILGTLGAAGALAVGWTAMPGRQRLVGATPLAVGPGQSALNGWVKIGTDNTVTIVMAQAEMGQGSHTGLAMLLADELDAAWSSVRLEQSSFDAIYNNQAVLADAIAPDGAGVGRRASAHLVGKLLREVSGMAGTGGSSSIKDQYLPMRQAGASARAMLVQAAAAQWKVAPADCRTEDGFVIHGTQRASYGELAARAALLALPDDVPLKPASAYKLVGKPVHRLDNAAKLNGSAVYGIDALPPGLLYASISMCPTLGGKVGSFDATAALAVRGVRKVVALAPVDGGLGSIGSTSGGVAVVADTPFQAMRALEKVRITWDHGAAATVSSAAMLAALGQGLDRDGAKVHLERGDVVAALSKAASTIHAEYRVPLLAHATMEPMNATVQFKDGAATVWTGTQVAGMTRDAVAKALSIDAAKVVVHVPFLGGGFGRRYFSDCAVQAAQLARVCDGAPVQLLWTREQDLQHDYYRPAFVARCTAGFDAAGALLAWQSTSAGSSMGVPGFADPSNEGVSDTAYAFPNARVAHQTVEAPISMGIWRSVSHSQNGFFTESFIDECAAASKQDPLAYRRALLAGDARHLRVLARVAELSGWGTPLAPAADGAPRARGLAIHQSFGSVVAQVAEVSLSPDRQIRVHRVVCVIDCGVAVNPQLVRQQMESGIVFGLSAALHGEIGIAAGQVQQSNFHDYAPLRFDESPVIETDIIASTAKPGGAGEPGTPPIAPAVANAVFALTGTRLRSLPLRLA